MRIARHVAHWESQSTTLTGEPSFYPPRAKSDFVTSHGFHVPPSTTVNHLHMVRRNHRVILRGSLTLIFAAHHRTSRSRYCEAVHRRGEEAPRLAPHARTGACAVRDVQ